MAEEIIQHLESLPTSRVRITLEIEAEFDDDVPDGIVRTVNENARVLKFNTFGFEE